MKKIKILLILVLLLPNYAFAQKLKVVASFSILGDMVHNIGGDKISLTIVVPNQMDAHSFIPSPSDAKALKNASVVFINGIGFEGWIEKLINASGYKGNVVVASKGVSIIKAKENEEHESGHNEHEEHSGHASDPHAWQSLPNGEVYVKNISDELIKLDPANAKTYRENARSYIAQIRKLDEDIKKQISLVPVEKRKVITSHDAFGYFEKEYGIEFLSVVGLSTEEQPSAKKVQEIIQQVRENKVKALFIENISNPSIMQQIAKDGGGVIGGKLYSDSLSSKEEKANTYLNMLKYNANTLIEGIR
jgi:zinc/manganese transport system substrate-binding protein